MKYLIFDNTNGGSDEAAWKMFAVNSDRRDEDLEILGVPKDAVPDLEFEAESHDEAMVKFNEYMKDD